MEHGRVGGGAADSATPDARGAGGGGGGEGDLRSAGFPNGLRARGGGGMGRDRDVVSRDAFEALLPCIFHADAVHDEVRGDVEYSFVPSLERSFGRFLWKVPLESSFGTFLMLDAWNCLSIEAFFWLLPLFGHHAKF